jgi:hypothetical protein
MTLANNPHFAIGFGCELARVYYQDKLFVCIRMTRENYCPFATAKMAHMSDYLIDLFQSHGGEIDFKLNYPNTFPKKKKAKIQQLLKDKDCNQNTLNRWMSLLFI